MHGEKNVTWRIGAREFGTNDDVLVIAEIGMNHNGDFDTARALVDAAYAAGADAVKFQMRDLESLYGPDSRVPMDIGAQYVKDIVEGFALTNVQIMELMGFAESRGLIALCTPFDYRSLNFLVDNGASGIKLASADFVNPRMISLAIETGLPVLASTGMTTEGEIVRSIRLIRALAAPGQVALLHCHSAYPAPITALNLRYINRLSDLSELVVGYSGHERGINASVSAVALGARIVERHITFDNDQEGPDHQASLTPDDFAAMVHGIRQVSSALGSAAPRELSQGEKMNRLSLGKSLVASTDIDPGTILSDDLIVECAPGVGLPPYRRVDLIGHQVWRTVAKGEAFVEEDFDGWGQEQVNFNFSRPWGIPVRFRDYAMLLERMTPNFLEFHLGRDDLDYVFTPSDLNLSEFDLVVHSPDVFANDHLLDLSNSDERYARESLGWLQRVIDKTREWSAQFKKGRKPTVVVSIGGFSSRDRFSRVERDEAYDRLAERIGRLDDLGVQLSMQTLPPFPWYFGGQYHCNLFVDPESTRDFAERVSKGICLDISHTQMSCTWLKRPLIEAAEILLPVTNHLHIADAVGESGEGIQIGEGDIDFAGLIPIFQTMAPEVPFIPEIWQGHLSRGAGFIEALHRLEAMFRESNTESVGK